MASGGAWKKHVESSEDDEKVALPTDLQDRINSLKKKFSYWIWI